MKLFEDYLPYLVEIEEPKPNTCGCSLGGDYCEDGKWETACNELYEYKLKRYPTKALKWKEWHIENVFILGKVYYLKRNDGTVLKVVWSHGWDRHPLEHLSQIFIGWIEAEAYEQAKAKEDMWLQLGEGWKMSNTGFSKFYAKDGIEITIYDEDEDFNNFIEIAWEEKGNVLTATIPIEICTLEIVQKIIEQIKK
jgi:hypothetical protein